MKIALRSPRLLSLLPLLVGLLYAFSNPRPYYFSDHTNRIAKAMLSGSLGLAEKPPDFISEMVLRNGLYYSVFPLGSVVAMLPIAALERLGVWREYPAQLVHGCAAFLIALYALLLTRSYSVSAKHTLIYVVYLCCGTWLWCNLVFLGPWHLNLGLALAGQLAAIYYSTARKRPFWSGFWFAFAFGHRTEILILAPLFLYLLVHGKGVQDQNGENLTPVCATRVTPILLFCSIPFLLGLLTLLYNYLRFSSPLTFGYSLIPGVLDPDNYVYRHGIFAISWEYIERNMKHMLLYPWRCVGEFPYLIPSGWGGSIFINSPFLFLIFRELRRLTEREVIAWLSIAALTAILWCHGEPGGWQFAYRYAIVLLPWFFLILLETDRKTLHPLSLFLFSISVALNAYAVYLYHWTNYVSLPGSPDRPCPLEWKSVVAYFVH